MKITSFLCLTVAAACLTACSEDESAPVADVAKNIAGTYVGTTMAEFPYSAVPMYTFGESLTVAPAADGKMALNFESAEWGTTVVPSLVVTKGNSGYSVSGEGTSVMSMGGATPREYAATLTGTLSADKAVYTFVVSLPIMGGTTLTFSNLIPAVSGTYEGATTAEFPYSSEPMVTADETLSIIGKADGSCALKFVSADWGTTEAVLLVTADSDGTYLLTGEGQSALAMGGGTPKEYTCSVSGRITADRSACNIVVSLPIMGGTTLTFASAPAEQ